MQIKEKLPSFGFGIAKKTSRRQGDLPLGGDSIFGMGLGIGKKGALASLKWENPNQGQPMKMQDNKQQSLTSGKSEGMSSQGNGSQKKRSIAVSFNKPANQAQNKISAVQQFRQKKPSIEIRRRDSKAEEKEQIKMMKAKIQTSPLVDPEPATPVDG